MEKLIVINGSPRSFNSNSKQYANIILKFYKKNVEYVNLTKNNHYDILKKINFCNEILFVFPLYADSIPVFLLNFLIYLEENFKNINKITISVLINCGFYEYSQNDIAVEMMKLYAKKINANFGSVLKIGSGEAILKTPFKILLKWKIKKFSQSIEEKKYKVFNFTMPISKSLFVKASKIYWKNYGKKYNVSEE